MTKYGCKKVEITWIDSIGVTSSWEFYEDLPPMKPMKCKTVGYLVDGGKKYVTVAQSLATNQLLGRLTIPTVAIKKIKLLDKG